MQHGKQHRKRCMPLVVVRKRVLNQVTDATFFPGSYFALEARGRQIIGAVSLRF